MTAARSDWPALGPQPLVTIVTPSLNTARYIGATIESVLAQDYPAIEYLVMDGGSTDGTVDILRRYAGRLHWVSSRDGGQSAAINAGWRRGQGSIVAWLNADDLLLPGAVRQAVAALQTTSAAAVYGECDIIDEHGQLLRPYITVPFDLTGLVCGVTNTIPQPTVFIRRAALDAAGYLDERLHMVMDFELWLRLGLQSGLHYLPQRLGALRDHPQTKTNTRPEDMVIEYLEVYHRLFGRNDLPPELRAREGQAMATVLLLVANSCYMAGRLTPAQHYVRASVGRDRRFLQRRTVLKLLALGPLGRPGWWAYTTGRRALLGMLARR